MTESYLEDMYEPNNRKDQAQLISVSKMISASFSNGNDQDWYALDAPYNGSVNLMLQLEGGYTAAVTHINADGIAQNYTLSGGQTIELPVTKGKNYVQLQLKDRTVKEQILYKLQTSFNIYKDEFEDNDRQYKAYVLPMRSQTITGTFHQYNDQDWYMLHVEQSGTLSVKLSVDTARIDPVLFIQKQGEKGMTIDRSGDGGTESWPTTEVFPGNYYIRVNNIKDYPYPVTGEYKLAIHYETKMIDPNEPNDKPYQATVLKQGNLYEGVIDKETDADWFLLKVNEESLVDLQLSGIPDGVNMTISVYDNNLKQFGSTNNPWGTDEAKLSQRWQAGTYYIKLTAGKPFDNQMYGLKANVRRLIGGFADIEGHWAVNDILVATYRNLIDGYDNYLFKPDKTITRAEAAAILVRGFKLSKPKTISYTDLSPSHWAYPYVSKAAQAGIVEGYPDQSFAPDQPVTRMEMTAMMARAMKIAGKKGGAPPFIDVKEDDWGASLLVQMKAEGWVSGFPDGTFRPEQPATRAEFVAMLTKMVY
jgi:hypothetical protein